MATPAAPTRPSFGMRLLYAIPLLGRVAREIAEDRDNALYAVVIVFTLLVLAALKWGIVVFTLAALCAVPLIFLFFVVICWPFPAKPRD
jgi:hypothetical protein